MRRLLDCGFLADVAQLVERNLAKVEVAGSIPVVRSKTPVHQGLSASTSHGALSSPAEHSGSACARNRSFATPVGREGRARVTVAVTEVP
jgi:hypothetical protein